MFQTDRLLRLKVGGLRFGPALCAKLASEDLKLMNIKTRSGRSMIAIMIANGHDMINPVVQRIKTGSQFD